MYVQRNIYVDLWYRCICQSSIYTSLYLYQLQIIYNQSVCHQVDKIDHTVTNSVFCYYFKFENYIDFNCKLLNIVSTNQPPSFFSSLHFPLHPFLSPFFFDPCLPPFSCSKHSLVDCQVVDLMVQISMRLCPCCAGMAEGQIYKQGNQKEFFNETALKCSDRTGNIGVVVLRGILHDSCGFL